MRLGCVGWITVEIVLRKYGNSTVVALPPADLALWERARPVGGEAW
jgi:hypothetical protein